MTPARFAGVCVAVLALAACSWRQRLVTPYLSTFPPDQKVEVWRRADRVLLSHVTLDSAAVNGVASPWRPSCGSCRVSIRLAEVDSLVAVHDEAGYFLGGTALLVAITLLNDCRPFARTCFD